MMLFLRLFSGCLLQLFSFALLCLYPFMGHFRMTKKRVRLGTGLLLAALSGFFASVVVVLRGFVAPENLFNATNLVFLGCIIPCLLWYLYVVQDFWQKRLFVFMFTLVSATMITSMNNTICTALIADADTDHLPYYGIAMPILLVVLLITVPLLLLLLKKAFVPLNDFLPQRGYTYLCILSGILLLVLGIGLIPMEYTYLYHPMTIYLYIALQVLVFFIYLVVFGLFYFSQKRVFAERRLSQSEAQIRVQAEQYHRLMDKISETKRAKHDMRHQLLAMKQYAQAGNRAELLQYIDAQLQNLDSLVIEQYSENEMVNMLVSHYMALAESSQVKMSVQINCAKELSIPTPEFSVLLGNLLENAQIAAKNAPVGFRFITLNILQQANLLVITLDNGFDGKIAYRDGTYCSTKEGHEGFGLGSIAQIAEKYGGTAKFAHDGKVFKASVMLQA